VIILKEFVVDVQLSDKERKALGGLVRDSFGPDVQFEIARIAQLHVTVEVKLQEKTIREGTGG
jgi:hypothetical protein